MIVHIPDLLHATPWESTELPRARQLLSYAFVSGDSDGALHRFLDQAQVGPVRFQAGAAGAELFLGSLVEQSMAFTSQGFSAPMSLAWLQRVISSPPRDPASVGFRQAIHAELAEDETACRELVRLYRALVELREDLDTPSVLGGGYFTQKRVDVLGRIKDCIDLAASSFGRARSGLRRVRDYALEVQQTPGYQDLAELLDYEGHMAEVQLGVRVGADGRLRELEIVQVEVSTSPFHLGPLGRLWTHLRLLWQGVRLTEAGLVARWVERIFEGIADDLSYLPELIGHLEVYLAGLAFTSRCRQAGLSTCLPSLVPAAPLRLEAAFNPHLLGGEQRVVPCDLSTSGPERSVLVTGPNSGGKTRLLQTVALVQLLGQSGFPVPAASATLRPVSGVFVSLSVRTRADQREGRLGMELLRIRDLFEAARPGALVVLDELCSGTNPAEGEEIFHLVLDLLDRLGCDALISTHFLRFAGALAQHPAGLSLDFLQAEQGPEHRPTFQFVQGVASTSQARHIARRLGVTREALEALVDEHRGEEALDECA